MNYYYAVNELDSLIDEYVIARVSIYVFLIYLCLQKQSFCIHLIGAELQFEGDTLKKWETFFLHFMHDVKELTIVLIGPELNTSKLPVELLGRIK